MTVTDAGPYSLNFALKLIGVLTAGGGIVFAAAWPFIVRAVIRALRDQPDRFNKMVMGALLQCEADHAEMVRTILKPELDRLTATERLAIDSSTRVAAALDQFSRTQADGIALIRQVQAQNDTQSAGIASLGREVSTMAGKMEVLAGQGAERNGVRDRRGPRAPRR